MRPRQTWVQVPPGCTQRHPCSFRIEVVARGYQQALQSVVSPWQCPVTQQHRFQVHRFRASSGDFDGNASRLLSCACLHIRDNLAGAKVTGLHPFPANMTALFCVRIESVRFQIEPLTLLFACGHIPALLEHVCRTMHLPSPFRTTCQTVSSELPMFCPVHTKPQKHPSRGLGRSVA
jgi:hypothetical protein